MFRADGQKSRLTQRRSCKFLPVMLRQRLQLKTVRSLYTQRRQKFNISTKAFKASLPELCENNSVIATFAKSARPQALRMR